MNKTIRVKPHLGQLCYTSHCRSVQYNIDCEFPSNIDSQPTEISHPPTTEIFPLPLQIQSHPSTTEISHPISTKISHPPSKEISQPQTTEISQPPTKIIHGPPTTNISDQSILGAALPPSHPITGPRSPQTEYYGETGTGQKGFVHLLIFYLYINCNIYFFY